MDIKEWFDSLDEDLQNKVMECKNIKELKDLLTEEKIELSDELLDTIAGGSSGTDDPCYIRYMCPVDLS